MNATAGLHAGFLVRRDLSVRTMFDGEGFEEADGKGFWSFRE